MEPVDALRRVEATVEVVTPDGEGIRVWNDESWVRVVAVEEALTELDPDDCDALLLSGDLQLV